ncbi:hypothetical protein [Undibacterium terreum]|uniref:Uncharacterized protein n=1 Tax=Undibacterium terreum TaxID=1224302 RepID=A0A916V0C1_9BURK|nr:hypothetical protein [Undibacterium terreum]GGC96069.1 hypothetical protein GCM10011396_49340 [Undibacterium terreum]
MRLLDVTITPSPRTPGYTRSTGSIAYDNGEQLQVWVDVPDAIAAGLSDSGNPWLIAMLPMAATRHENIELSLPVDGLLKENLGAVLRVWVDWFPDLAEIAIDCPTYHTDGLHPDGKIAAFFSGGVDSYFTLARHLPDKDYGLPCIGDIDDLLTVWGFDVRIHNETGFTPLLNMLTHAAGRIGRNHFVIHTNLRDQAWTERWAQLTHGAGMGFVSLMLEKRYRQVLLGSSYPYPTLLPWGSHPMTDPLFSTSTTQVVHDGAVATRVEKTELVARFPPAQTALHVCMALPEKNCSHCEKCYRTMITLDILGKKEAMAESFDWSRYDLAKIKKLSVGGIHNLVVHRAILQAAEKAGRQDIASGLRQAMWRSTLSFPFLKISERLFKLPGVWRAGMLLRKLVLHKKLN